MKDRMIHQLLLVLMITLGALSPAYAGTESMLKLLDVLEKNGTIDAETAAALRTSVQDEEGDAKAEVKVSLKKGKLKMNTADGDFKFGVHGRVQTDYAWYNSDKNQLGNGGEVRRARLAVKGTAWENWHYTAQFEFTGDEEHLKTTDLRYTGFDGWELQAGHFHQPFSMEKKSTSKTITFMERALPNAFTPERDLGFAAQYVSDLWRVKAGIFSIVDGNGDGDSGESNDSWEFSGRFNVTPIHDKHNVLHLGLGGSYREIGGDGKIRFRARPESHVTGVRLVDTGDTVADSRYLLGLEGAYLYGPFSIMGEYITASVDRKTGKDVDFDGFYGQASYVLTGESRQYKRKSGSWGGVEPKEIFGQGGFGAWEVAARLSSIDLSDDDIDGGEQDSLSFALNWYATPTLRFNANYVNVLKVSGGDNDGDEPSLFQVRAQYEF